jgi:hypothetical protein
MDLIQSSSTVWLSVEKKELKFLSTQCLSQRSSVQNIFNVLSLVNAHEQCAALTDQACRIDNED